MTNKITIKLNYGTDVDFPLTGKFVDKATRKRIFLLHDHRVLIDIDPKDSEKVFKYPFNKNNRVFTFEWESSDVVKSEFAKWLKQHPLVKHDENKNIAGQTYFLLYDMSKEDEVQFEKENSKVVVYNMLKSMTEEGLREVAYFKMIDPGTKTSLQLFNILCGLDNGILMDKPLEFISAWKLSNRDKQVVIQKAIVLDIIQTKTSEGTKPIFIINNVPIGSVDNLLAYFNENQEQYDFLVKDVAAKDNLPFGVAKERSVEEAIKEMKAAAEPKDRKLSAAVKEENKANRDNEKRDDDIRKNQQVARLRELNVKGWAASAAWSEEVRLKKITDAEALLVEA